MVSLILDLSSTYNVFNLNTCISNKFPVFATCRKNEIAVILCWHNLLWLNAYISCLCIFNQDLVTVKILCYQRVAYSSLNCELLKARPRLYIIHNVISKIVFVYIELLKVGSRNFEIEILCWQGWACFGGILCWQH